MFTSPVGFWYHVCARCSHIEGYFISELEVVTHWLEYTVAHVFHFLEGLFQETLSVGVSSLCTNVRHIGYNFNSYIDISQSFFVFNFFQCQTSVETFFFSDGDLLVMTFFIQFNCFSVVGVGQVTTELNTFNNNVGSSISSSGYSYQAIIRRVGTKHLHFVRSLCRVYFVFDFYSVFECVACIVRTDIQVIDNNFFSCCTTSRVSYRDINFKSFNTEVIGQSVTTFKRTTGFFKDVQVEQRQCATSLWVPFVCYFFTDTLISEFIVRTIVETFWEVFLFAFSVFQETTFVSIFHDRGSGYDCLKHIFELVSNVLLFQDRHSQTNDWFNHTNGGCFC